MTPKTFKKTTRIIDNVISCAAKYFRKHGYKKTTVDEIAARVHISKKTLYTYFSSKKDILKEVAWRDTVEILQKFSDTIPQNSHPDTVLLAFCRFMFTDRIKNGKNGLFWGLYSDDSDIMWSYIESLKRVVKEIYENGRQNGVFKPVDSFFATEAIVALIIAAGNNFHKTTNPVRMTRPGRLCVRPKFLSPRARRMSH